MQARVHTAAAVAAAAVAAAAAAAATRILGMARNQLMASNADRRMLTQAMLR